MENEEKIGINFNVFFSEIRRVIGGRKGPTLGRMTMKLTRRVLETVCLPARSLARSLAPLAHSLRSALLLSALRAPLRSFFRLFAQSLALDLNGMLFKSVNSMRRFQIISTRSGTMR